MTTTLNTEDVLAWVLEDVLAARQDAEGEDYGIGLSQAADIITKWQKRVTAVPSKTLRVRCTPTWGPFEDERQVLDLAEKFIQRGGVDE